MRAVGILLLVAGVVLALIVPLALGGRSGLSGLFELPSAAWACVAAVVVGGWFAKAVKFWLLARPFPQAPGLWHNFAISLGTDFAFCASPAGVAGYPTNLYLLRRAGLSWSAASAVVAAEQILDLAFFAVAFPAATLVSLQTGALTPAWTDAIGVLALLCVLGLGVLLIRPARRAIAATVRAVTDRIGVLRRRREALVHFVSEIRVHGRTLLSADPAVIAVLLAVTALYWLSRYAVLWIALIFLGHPKPFLFLLLLQSLIMHLAQWTGIPGGGGSADVALVAALGGSIPAPAAATALLLWRIGTFYVIVLAGAASFAMLAARRNAGQPAPAPE